MDALLQHEMQATRHALVRIAIALEDSRSVPEESTSIHSDGHITLRAGEQVQAGSEPALDDLGEGGEGIMTIVNDLDPWAVDNAETRGLYMKIYQAACEHCREIAVMNSKSDDRPNNT